MIERVATYITLAICVSFMVAACGQLPYSTTGAQAPVRPQAPSQAKPPVDAAQASDAEAPSPNEYRLGPGDVVKISVYNNQDLTTETEISQNGKVSFPLIGEVTLGGLTKAQAEKAISQRLDKGGFVPKAYVNLLISQYRSRQVSVIGEVNKPGKYSIDKMVSLTDLLAMAGGITPKGSSVISIIKKDENGKAAQYQLDVKNVFTGGDLSKNVRIDSDDIIYVPPLPVFYIYGEVRQPGSYPLTADMTVRQALSVGGGLTVRGTERGIKVERKGSDGKPKTYGATLTDKLRADDVVYVPESWF
jgi:polysaccharide export outer membrane protein